MAQQVRVILLDDLTNDGTTEADETVSFSLDGTDYEIDLTKENAHTLRARLKEFRQAARVVGRNTKHAAKSRPRTAGTATPRPQGGIDPATVRAWAVTHGLIPSGQRGRLATKYRDAYTAAQAGDSGPLNQLKAALETAGDTPTPHQPSTPRDAQRPAPHSVPDPEPKAEDPAEREARQHYQPLTQRSPEMADDKKWARRTAHGCERTDKVEQMTLVERLNAVAGGQSDRNMTILGMLAGVIPLKGGKVSYLSGSALRLQNLEMVQYAPESEHGWEITDFGRYAHKIHSMG